MGCSTFPDSRSKYQVELLDLTGKIIQQFSPDAGTSSIETGEKLSPGIYFIRWKDQEGYTGVERIIKN